MLHKDLLGRSITAIAVRFGCVDGELDTALCYLRLDTGVVINFPWPFDAPAELVPTEVGMPLDLPTLTKIPFLLHQPIVDVVSYKEGEALLTTCLLELANGYLLSEVQMAPSGTGAAGLWYFASITDVEARVGDDYRRLRQVL